MPRGSRMLGNIRDAGTYMNQSRCTPGGTRELLQGVLLDKGLGHCRGELRSGERCHGDQLAQTNDASSRGLHPS